MIKNKAFAKVSLTLSLCVLVLAGISIFYLQQSSDRTSTTGSNVGTSIQKASLSKYSTLVKTGEEKNGDRAWYYLYNQGDAVIDVEYKARLPVDKNDPTYPNFQNVYFYESGENKLLPNKLGSAIIINGEEGAMSSFINFDNYTDKKGWCFLGIATIRIKNYKELLVEAQSSNRVDLIEIINNKPFANNEVVCQ